MPAEVVVIDPSQPPDSNHRTLSSGGSLQSPAGIAFFPVQPDQTRHVRVTRLARSAVQRPAGGAGTRSFFDVLQLRNTGSIPIPGPVTVAWTIFLRPRTWWRRTASPTTPRRQAARYAPQTSGPTAS
jgi:hypothetical protein